jgi:hypothetical protein
LERHTNGLGTVHKRSGTVHKRSGTVNKQSGTVYKRFKRYTNGFELYLSGLNHSYTVYDLWRKTNGFFHDRSSWNGLERYFNGQTVRSKFGNRSVHRTVPFCSDTVPGPSSKKPTNFTQQLEKFLSFFYLGAIGVFSNYADYFFTLHCVNAARISHV